MTAGRQRAFSYIDHHEAGSRVTRYDRQARTFAKVRNLDLSRTIVDCDGRGAHQLVRLLRRYPGSVVLIPRRDNLQYIGYRDLAEHAAEVFPVEVAR